MSNTSVVTPYGSIVRGFSSCVASVATGIGDATRWLTEETLEDRNAADRYRKDRRQERLSSSNLELSSITIVNLHHRDPEGFVHSAEKLGYNLEPLSQPLRALSEQPQILLRRASGERMVVRRNDLGGVSVQTAGETTRVQEVVQQHTVDQVNQYLVGAGMNVRTAVLSNGEVQILATEQPVDQPGGPAEVKTQINADGTAWVDVEKIRGPRCHNIVSEIAEAIGGEISWVKHKDSPLQLPGEPAKTKVRV